MAKPPFRYKPTKQAQKSGEEQVQLEGTADIDATYSDVFVVTNEAGTGMANLFFYQRLLGDREVILGTTDARVRAPKAKCVSRIVLSDMAIQKLLEALARNRGFTLTPSKDDQNE